MASSYTYTCYLIDVSPSMGEPHDPDGEDPTRTKLSYALEFAKTKVIQRLINPKKTDQIAVVTFGGETNNTLADGRDGYDNIEELIDMRQPNYNDLKRLDNIRLGEKDVDLVSALYVAGNLVRNAKVARKDAKKQVVLLTDAEEKLKRDDKGDVIVETAWDDEAFVSPLYDAIIPGLNGAPIDWKDHFTLGIIGMDFGDPSADEESRSSWSQQKRINVDALAAMVERINRTSDKSSGPRAIIGNVIDAIAGAGEPAVAPIQTRRQLVKLNIGDIDDTPDEAIQIQVEIQKATQKAPVKTFSKMRRDTWHKSLADNGSLNAVGSSRKRRRDEDEVEDEIDGDIDPGQIIQEKQWYYAPEYNIDGTLKENDTAGESDSEDEADRIRRTEAERRLDTDENLSRAYKYGTDLIPIPKEEEQDFYTFPAGEAGIFVRGFVKASDFHPEWALNDPFWLFGGQDNRSQITFSSLLWALRDTGTYALVRMLQPKSVQPRLCLLAPMVGGEAGTDQLEMGLLIQMPFKEEVANWSFPSLDRIHTTTGREVTEHRLLPKKDLLGAMDDFLDTMMLPAYPIDDDTADAEDIKPDDIATVPWFEATESYNPAIHNIRNAIIYKILHPNVNLDKIHLEVHPTLQRYLYPPEEVLDVSGSAALNLQKVANLTLIPPKPKLAKGRGRRKLAQKPTSDALEDILGTQEADTDEEQNGDIAEVRTQHMQSQNLYRSPQSRLKKERIIGDKGEQDDSTVNRSKLASAEPKSALERGEEVSSSGTEVSNDENDTEAVREGQRPNLISTDHPIEDFEMLLEQPGLITRAISQMLTKIQEFLDESSSSSAYAKALKCLIRLREVAILEDEALRYNDFLRKLKSSSTRTSFLETLKSQNVGLITLDENEDLEGAVSFEEAATFWQK